LNTNNERKEQDFQYFIKCLKLACKNIESDYFKISTAGSENKIYRERVYTYELYHRIRCILMSNFNYLLFGELSKQGHAIIAGGKMPDLLVHIPGTMDNNLVIIEIKSTSATNTASDFEVDLNKLEKFLNLEEGEYYRAIELIYGSDDLDETITENFQEWYENNSGRLIFLRHKKVGEEPYIIFTPSFKFQKHGRNRFRRNHKKYL